MKVKDKRESRRQRKEVEGREKINKLESKIKESLHENYSGLDLSRGF